MVDSVYAPVRDLCEKVLERQGVVTTFYPPDAGAGIATYIRPETQVIYCESPGSHTFEVQDVPAIGQVAAARGIPVVVDNTWATPYYFKPLRHGADLAIQAATKYLVGHSDAMLGVVTCTEAWLPALQRSSALAGNSVSADDCFLALRGMRTLAVRLRQHYEGAMKVAGWLQGRPHIKRVLYPPLTQGPEHALWKRDFTGASGLFGVEFDHACEPHIEAFVDSLALFGIGVSWGGFESLVLPSHVRRSLATTSTGPLVRFHIGLEDPDDLIADLAAGLERLTQPR
jgi:cystathionine beta-lyase